MLRWEACVRLRALLSSLCLVSVSCIAFMTPPHVEGRVSVSSADGTILKALGALASLRLILFLCIRQTNRTAHVRESPAGSEGWRHLWHSSPKAWWLASRRSCRGENTSPAPLAGAPPSASELSG